MITLTGFCCIKTFIYHDDPVVADFPFVGTHGLVDIVRLDLDVVDVVALVGGTPQFADDLVDLTHSFLLKTS